MNEVQEVEGGAEGLLRKVGSVCMRHNYFICASSEDERYSISQQFLTTRSTRSLGVPEHGLDGLAASPEAVPKDGAWARVQSGSLGDCGSCVRSLPQRSHFKRVTTEACRTAQRQVHDERAHVFH